MILWFRFLGRGGGGNANLEIRPNDWRCPCGNVNFGFRQECNHCRSPRADGSGGGGGGGGPMRGPPRGDRNGGRDGGRDRDRNRPY